MTTIAFDPASFGSGPMCPPEQITDQQYRCIVLDSFARGYFAQPDFKDWLRKVKVVRLDEQHRSPSAIDSYAAARHQPYRNRDDRAYR